MGRLIDETNLMNLLYDLDDARHELFYAIKKIPELPTIEAIPIPKGATNGDVIKAMFPNSQVINHHSYVEFDIKDCEESQYYDCGWWNSPYKEQQNENAEVRGMREDNR